MRLKLKIITINYEILYEIFMVCIVWFKRHCCGIVELGWKFNVARIKERIMARRRSKTLFSCLTISNDANNIKWMNWEKNKGSKFDYGSLHCGPYTQKCHLTGILIIMNAKQNIFRAIFTNLTKKKNSVKKVPSVKGHWLVFSLPYIFSFGAS